MPLAENSKEADGTPHEAIDQATARAYWKKTSSLMWTVLAIWLLSGFVIHIFAPSLNAIHIFGFPMGFYMAAQGSLTGLFNALGCGGG